MPFDTVWFDDLIYKHKILNFPSYLFKTISSYLKSRAFEASFYTASCTSRLIQTDVAQGGIISTVLFSFYVNNLLSPSSHIELALYAADMSVIVTCRQPALFVIYLETYLSDFEAVAE